MVELLGEVIVEHGLETSLCLLLTGSSHHTGDGEGIRLDEFAEDMDAEIACGTCEQNMTQRL